MGNSNKKKQKVVHEHNHLRLRNAKEHIVKNKSYIKANFPVSSKEDFVAWEKSLKKPPAATAKHAFVPNQLKSKSGMCGSSATAEAQYPSYWYLLSDEIKNRRKEGNTVDEKQIWQILYALSQTSKQYHKSNMKVGDIRPANILLDDQGDIKLVTQHSWPQEQTNYIKTLRNGEKTYLAPQEMKDIDLGRNNQSTNIQDGDAFSLGLTALDCALLEESYGMYPKKGEIDLNLLQEKRNRLRKSGFSPQLKAAILSMTDPNPDNRAVPGEIHDWLKRNEIQIYNMHPFTPSGSSPYGVSMFLDKSRQKQPVNYSQLNQTSSRTVNTINQNGVRPVSNLPEAYSRMVYVHETNKPSFENPNQYSTKPQQTYQPRYQRLPQEHRNQVVDYITRNKPAPIVQMRYLDHSQVPQTMNTNRQSTFTRPAVSSQFYSNTNRPTLREVYTSPEILSRQSSKYQSYIPKSQQKQIKRPTYDFGNTINFQNISKPPGYSSSNLLSQGSNFQLQPNSLVDHLKQRNTINNEQEIDRPKTQTVVVNRGSRPEVVTVHVEEDLPEIPKMSNWEVNRNQIPTMRNTPPPENNYSQNTDSMAPEIEEDLPYKPKMSYWTSNTQTSPRRQNFSSKIPTIPETPQQDSRLRSNGRETPSRSNMQPLQSAYQSQQQTYKISFFNNNRNYNQGGDGIFKASSGQHQAQAPSGYQSSPVLQSNSEAPRIMTMKKKKDNHEKINEEQVRQKMNAQTTQILDYSKR